MESLFYVGLIFVLGAMTQWLSPKLHIPRVVGYLLLGLIIGPEILGLIPRDFVENSYVITDLALSVIAVLVGATLKVSNLKGRGKEIITITLFQSMGTFICVALGFFLLGEALNFPMEQVLLIALLLAGIATATAPATPLAIVRELGAKGKFTSTFLAIVATDDAIALMMFALALAIGTGIMESGAFGWASIFEALLIISLSSGLGIIAALINTALEKSLKQSKGMEAIVTLGLIFIVYSLSEYWKLEPLLTAMIMGVVMVNTSSDFDLVEEEIDNHLAEIIFMLFFIISAMHLHFSAVYAYPFAIELYVVLRFFGKVAGSYLGAVISKSSDKVKKYMGIALIPQAGVAIGLALSLHQQAGCEEIAPIILNIIITTTLIHELAGPFFIKYALTKSAEIK